MSGNVNISYLSFKLWEIVIYIKIKIKQITKTIINTKPSLSKRCICQVQSSENDLQRSLNYC